MWGPVCTNSSHAAVPAGGHNTQNANESRADMSRSTGKSSSRATEWSQWEWNTDGYWESWRYNSRGLTEWKREPPSSSAPADPQIPRNQEGLYASMPSAYTDQQVSDQPPTAQIYNSRETTSPSWPAGTSSQYAGSGTNADHTGDHYDLYSAESSTAPSSSTYYNTAFGAFPDVVGNATYNTVPSTSVRSPDYSNSQPPSNYVATTADVDTLTRGMGAMSVGSASAFDQEYDSQAASPYPTRHIQANRHRSKAEKLDPRYQVVSSKDSRSFWKNGRVFMMLWTEPAGYKAGGGTKGNSHISGTWLNEKAYSEIRRFVVVQNIYGSCSCLAIHTYNNLATLKPNLPDPDNHAVIYTSKEPPGPFSVLDEYGNRTYERLTKDPIKVNSELKGEDGRLRPESRINYSKIYCVEKDVRVLNIGMVDKKSMNTLEFNCPLKPQNNYHY